MKAVSLCGHTSCPSHAARIRNSLPRTEGRARGTFGGHLILAREGKHEGEGDRERICYLIISDLVF